MKVLDVVTVAAIVFAAYGLGHRDGKFSAEESARAARRKAVSDSAFAWQLIHARTTKQSSIVNRQMTIDSTHQVAHTASADSLAGVVAQLKDSLLGSYSAGDSLIHYRLIVRTQDQELEQLRSALAAAVRQIFALRNERDAWRANADQAVPIVVGLQQALEAEVAAHKCKILGLIQCPSRTTVAVASLLLGTSIGIVVTH